MEGSCSLHWVNEKSPEGRGRFLLICLFALELYTKHTKVFAAAFISKYKYLVCVKIPITWTFSQDNDFIVPLKGFSMSLVPENVRLTWPCFLPGAALTLFAVLFSSSSSLATSRWEPWVSLTCGHWCCITQGSKSHPNIWIYWGGGVLSFFHSFIFSRWLWLRFAVALGTLFLLEEHQQPQMTSEGCFFLLICV